MQFLVFSILNCTRVFSKSKFVGERKCVNVLIVEKNAYFFTTITQRQVGKDVWIFYLIFWLRFYLKNRVSFNFKCILSTDDNQSNAAYSYIPNWNMGNTDQREFFFLFYFYIRGLANPRKCFHSNENLSISE